MIKYFSRILILVSFSFAPQFFANAAEPIAGGEYNAEVDVDGLPYREIARRVQPDDGKTAPVNAFGVYDYWSAVWAEKYLDDLDGRSTTTGGDPRATQSAKCQSFIDTYTRDGVFDIRYALGYFDYPTGSNPIVEHGLDWGIAVSADEGIAVGIRKVLTRKCTSEDRRLCGFREITPQEDRIRRGKTVLTRDIEIGDRKVEARMTLTYASASPFYERNLTLLKAKQDRYTEASDENFFGGLRNADAVIYMGHARNGGGPDFNPPRLTPDKHVDYYGYYRKQFPGMFRMLKELKANSNKEIFLGLFSCDSKLHFGRRLLTQNPKQRVVLTLGGEAVLNYADTFLVSMGYIEGLLRGRCGASLEAYARLGNRERVAFQGYNL